MNGTSHPLVERLLKRIGASFDAPPSLDTWRALLDLVARTYRDADQDRYTIERAMEISSQEMQTLYQELRRRAAHEVATLRQSDERHRLLFEENPLPMSVIDVETQRFVAVTGAMIETYGYAREQLLSMHANDIELPDAPRPAILSAGDPPAHAIQHLGLRRHRRRDGATLEIDITIHALAISGRQCVLSIALDMTQTRRVEEELRQAQKMEAIGRLAGGVAHDFNNILAVVLANAEFALEDLGEAHATVPVIVEIRDAATRAAALTRKLLTFSRKQIRQPTALALNSVVTAIGSMLTRIVGEDIVMSAIVAPDLGTIEADRSELEQVLLNLVVNARDAMPEGGRLLIETTNTFIDEVHAARVGIAPGAYVSLAVSDTGCGMTEAVRLRAFEPFFTTKDVDKGTGLGLSTVFGIVKQGGGGITVYSELGHGTTFRIHWPRIDAPVTNETQTAFLPIRGTESILLVEDDAQLRQVLRRYLTSWGFTVLEAANGVTALELLGAHAGSVDLLLTDLVMPGGMDGRALSRRVLDARPQTRVVLMSGYTEHAALGLGAVARDDYFVQKPFTARTLSETLQRALASRAGIAG